MVVGVVRYLDVPPGRLPMRLASPFDPGPPHPILRYAAESLAAELAGNAALAAALARSDGGKMFGVLLGIDHAGRAAVLRAFSGMLDGQWHVTGFAPPLFDLERRDAFWLSGEAELGRIAAACESLERGRVADARAQLAALDARLAADRGVLAARHQTRRAERHVARAGSPAEDTRRALDQASRADSTERRRLDAAHVTERGPAVTTLAALDAELAALAAQRAARSRELLHQIHDTYVIPNARGELRALRALFAPHEPPGGAGDCAAPKLFAEAYRRGLRPVAVAERWIGAPPATGGRLAGAYYPACRGKCGPILAHMLEGLVVEPAPVFGANPAIAADEPTAIFEDRWLVVVDKPIGLLSVPGRGGALRDSVLARLRCRYPAATGPLLVHRLDLDTSGLLLVAKDAATHTALQAQFARRAVEKRYVAWLDGSPTHERGTIELALRVDLDDRPRQIHDPVHGKPAITEWTVLARAAGRTRVALVPRTGRTHQLRVHAAHPDGLASPIVGDRLDHPRPGSDRLQLHAETLTFVHPHTGERVTVERCAPF